MSPFFIVLNYHYWVLLNPDFSLRTSSRAPGNDFLDTLQVHPCKLYDGVRPPWKAGVSRMQEQFIDHAVEGPETRHPKLGSD